MSTETSIAIVVVSDTCSEDPSSDRTGPALLEGVDSSAVAGVTTVKYVSDNRDDIQDLLRILIAENYTGIFTAGGTGFSPRDVTPEAVSPLLDREAPGLVAAMLNTSLQITPFAALARPVAGVAGSTLLVTLPGSPKGAVENFGAISGVLPHALKLLAGHNSRSLHSLSRTISMNHGIEGRHSRSSSLARSYSLHSPASSVGSMHSHTHSNSSAHGHTHSHSHSHSDSHDHSHSHSHSHSHGHGSGPKFFGPAYRDRVSPYPLIPFDDAVAIVEAAAPEPIPTDVLLEDSIGYVLARNITAPVNVPSYRASIVDGYAVAHINFEGVNERVMQVSKVSHASSDLDVLPPNTCARITTGAPVPHGATAVIPVENTIVEEENDGEEVSVKIHADNVRSGDNVRQIGSDISIGSLALPRNTVISSLGGEIGLLASMGISQVPVFRKPVVGVLSTGDEVINPGESLSGSQIWDSNRPMLLANLRSWLGDDNVVDLGIAQDSMDALTDRVSAALDNVDVLITSGGVSMGELDLLKPLVRNLGGDIRFGRVLMKPGKPVTFATLPSNRVIIALPGNPVSCVVCLQLFGYPLLMRMMGQSGYSNDWVDVKLSKQVKLDPRPEFQRGIATQAEDGSWVWDSTGFQRSSCIKSMVRANALLRLPAATDATPMLKQGSTVKALFLGLNKIN